MEKFLLRDVDYSNIHTELSSIEYDKSNIDSIVDKYRYKNIKIYSLSVAQANILKQTALIYGADCAVNRNVVTGNINKSDVILCGSFSQINKIIQKLRVQPFKLAILANQIEDFLRIKPNTTKIIGILNVTPDSFSDGGLYYNSQDACKKIIDLVEDGADGIDIGAESTKPYSVEVSAMEQISRLKPVLKFIQDENLKIKYSVDTRSSEVADFVLNMGASIINDVSGLEFDNNMAKIVAKYNAGIILQHSKMKPEDTPIYNNVIDEIFLKLKQKIDFALHSGIQKIIIDPGIGFGKSSFDNINILDNIETFYSLGYPVMVGHSRKRFLNALNASNDQKDALTLAYSYPLIRYNVDYLRVHNVKLHKKLLNSIPT